FPLAPRSYHAILNHRSDRLKEVLSEEDPAYHEYSGILASVRELSNENRQGAENTADQRSRFEASRDRLKSLIASSKEVRKLVEDSVADFNGEEGDPGSFGLVQQLLAEQNYKLAFWQNRNESINYRRFFTIDDLVGVRVEDPLVFEATHGYILRLVSKSPGAGLRVDHIDGLRDPLAYLNRLQERLASDDSHKGSPSYVLVEKILSRHEALPEDWPVSGTTGYDYLNEANGVFVEPQGARGMEEIFSTFTGRQQSFADVVYEKKKLVMNTLLGVEMRTLGRQLADLADQDRYARELNREQLINALIEVTACLSVYRTYIRNMDLTPQATKYIEQAISEARGRATSLNPACFDFVREVLLILNPPHILVDQREARLAFVMRWQQFTGPIVAKGLEDTAVYVYHPLLSLNEVGGDPRPSEATSREQFYAFLEERRRNWPRSLDASTTHDTKRSEDVRARLNTLAEMPSEWEDHLKLWAKQNARFKTTVTGQSVPDRSEEYFLYQTLLGVWPLDSQGCASLLERVQAHIIKATREAMVHTRWTRPNQTHEDALLSFVSGILSNDNADFRTDFRQFQKTVAYFGMINGLSQTLLKIAAPGVPDFYQGSELWDLRLVDPDNRGAVDFDKRAADLDELVKAGASGQIAQNLIECWHDGRIKLYLIWRALRFRQNHEGIFRDGDFLPLQVKGSYSRNLVAFARRHGASWVLTAAVRWISQLPATRERNRAEFNWGDTRLALPSGSPSLWESVLTSEQVPSFAEGSEGYVKASDLFCDLPVALISGSSAS
ncbi:MAG: malto-oligosyltrehalose synthase, partial [Terriglobales bacterium]